MQEGISSRKYFFKHRTELINGIITPGISLFRPCCSWTKSAGSCRNWGEATSRVDALRKGPGIRCEDRHEPSRNYLRTRDIKILNIKTHIAYFTSKTSSTFFVFLYFASIKQRLFGDWLCWNVGCVILGHFIFCCTLNGNGSYIDMKIIVSRKMELL